MALLYKFPRLYDFMVEHFFNFEADPAVEEKLKEALQIETLRDGALVLDLACGTGIVSLWVAEERPDIRVIGVDISKAMVDKAIQLAQEKGLSNTRFIHKAAGEITGDDLWRDEPGDNPAAVADLIVCAHGYSAMPDGEAVFQHTLSFLPPGGRYVIMDMHYPRRDFFTLLFRYGIDWWLLGSNQFRQPWRYLEETLSNFTKWEKPVKDFGLVQGVYYVASGLKV